MKSRSMKHGLLSTFVVFALAACGGGGGGIPSTVGSNNPSPSTSPSTSPTANATGTIVDYAADAPLANVPIAIASWSPRSSPSPMATTDSNGKFAFNAAPGTYMLLVGSNSPTDTRATLHEKIVLNSGSNALIAATPQPEPDVTLVPSQSAGALRLMALSSTQRACLSGANQGRANASLRLLVPDEYLEEDAIADEDEEVAQNTDTPTPLFGYSQPFGAVVGMTTEINFAACASWSGPTYSYVSANPPYVFATNASNIWYGADFVSNPAQTSGTLGAQLWAADPR